MKRPMETNRLETGPPIAKRMCLDRAKHSHAPTVPTNIAISTGTIISAHPHGKLLVDISNSLMGRPTWLSDHENYSLNTCINMKYGFEILIRSDAVNVQYSVLFW